MDFNDFYKDIGIFSSILKNFTDMKKNYNSSEIVSLSFKII